jgi:glycosyltransferase involved in cell wall biosynthesis
MRLLLTMNLPYTRVHGGTNRSNRSLIEGLAQRQHSVRVVVPALATPSAVTHEQLLEELAREGISVRRNGAVDAFDTGGVEVHAVVKPSQLRGHLIDQIREFDPEWALVSAEDPTQNLFDAALKTAPSRIIYLAHTPQMFPFGPASLYPSKVRTELVGRAAAIVTISTFVADYIKEWTGFEAFVNHPPHFGSGPFPNLARFDDGYVLLMNACEVKGLSIFLALARMLPDVKFAALPGYGTTTSDRAKMSALQNVTLLKNEKNLDDILRRTRVLLMPSLWTEGFGMAVVDTMLRGIPVLASNFGGLVEAKLGTDYLLPVRPIERFEDRLDESLLPVPVVPDQDIDPWRDTLCSLLTKRELYEDQSANAREASMRFVSGLRIDPFEDLLAGLSSKRNKTAGSPVETHARRSLVDNSPGSASIHDNISHLDAKQRALLMRRLQKKASTQASRKDPGPRIERVSRSGHLPLSFAQQRLWLISQLEPDSAAYHMFLPVLLKGPLDESILERAVNEIINRHEVLRTTFTVVDDQPVQVIATSRPLALPVEDLSHFNEVARQREVMELATEEARKPFHLASGPLLRARLLRLAHNEHVFLLTMHHIISDGWSMGVFVREIVALYQAFSERKPSALPELDIQYADFAHWQRNWLSGEILEKQLAYWRKQLGGKLPVLQLPTERPRPPVQTFCGAAQPVIIPKELTQELGSLSQREGVTMFMSLLAAFQALLHLYSGQTDILVGTPIANRNHAEIEGLIGFFVNSLVMRTDLSDDPSFRKLLKRVREVTLGAYSHQDLPFEKIVEELQPERDPSRNPIFQVWFVLQNPSSAKQTAELPGLSLHTLDVENKASLFDLMLNLTQTPFGLGGCLEYNTDLFDRSTISRMEKHFHTLLTEVVKNPDKRISGINLISADEYSQFNDAFNEDLALEYS